MSEILRYILIIASIIVMIWILHKIRRSKVKMEDAIFWIIFGVILLILAIFPQISYKLSQILGIMSPANLIFLVIICLLVEKIFTLSIATSQLEEKVTILSAEVALRSHSQHQQIEKIEGEINSEGEKNI